MACRSVHVARTITVPWRATTTGTGHVPVAANTRVENLARLACAVAGAFWGVFWIPMRALDAAGIAGPWAIVTFYTVAVVLMLPVGLVRWRSIARRGTALLFIGLAAGTAMALYSIALLLTDVIRAVLLFYLTPLWSTILARVVLGERVTGPRMAAMAIGVSGLLVLFDADSGIPLPRNAGDWMGLGSGLVWAVAAVLMRKDEGSHAADIAFSFIVWSAVAALGLALVPALGHYPLPPAATLTGVLGWLVPIVALIVVPSIVAISWGAPLLSPGTVAILFMTEISVGALSAALLTDEPFGLRETSGVILITLAGLTEVIVAGLARALAARRTEHP